MQNQYVYVLFVVSKLVQSYDYLVNFFLYLIMVY